MDKNTKDILDALDFIKERLVTKDDVRDIIKEEVPPIVRAMIVEVVPGIVWPNRHSLHKGWRERSHPVLDARSQAD